MAEPFTPEHIVQLRERWTWTANPWLTGLATDRLFATVDALTLRLRLAEAVVEAAPRNLCCADQQPHLEVRSSNVVTWRPCGRCKTCLFNAAITAYGASSGQ